MKINFTPEEKALVEEYLEVNEIQDYSDNPQDREAFLKGIYKSFGFASWNAGKAMQALTREINRILLSSN